MSAAKKEPAHLVVLNLEQVLEACRDYAIEKSLIPDGGAYKVIAIFADTKTGEQVPVVIQAIHSTPVNLAVRVEWVPMAKRAEGASS